MKRPKKSKRTGSRKDIYPIVSIFAFVCCLVFRILLQYIIGVKGISFFCAANELYLLTGCVLAGGLSDAVQALVRYRVRREQYKNADKVLRCALLLGAVLGGVFGLFLFLGGEMLAETVLGVPLAGLAVNFMAPSVVFLVLTGAFKGYFRGNGSNVPAVHSHIIEILFLFAGGLTGAGAYFAYGQKVSALLRNPDYAAAYGAKGAAVGILAASVFCFLHMLVLFLMYHRNVKKQLLRDVQKNQDSMLRILSTLLGIWAPYALCAVLLYGLPLLDMGLFLRLGSKGTDAVSLWGGYYGRYLVFTGILCALISLSRAEPVRRIAYLADREVPKEAKDKLELLIRQLVLLSIPSAVFLGVFAENFLNLLFKGNNGDTASYMIWGGGVVVFGTFAGLFSDLLMRMRRMKYVIAFGAAGFLAHILLTALLLGNTKLSVTAVIIGNIVYYVILAGAGFFIVSRILRCRMDWLRPAALVVISAGIAGLAAMLLNKGISAFAGTLISLAICLPAGILLYVVLLIVTRAVARWELENMWLGGLLIRLGEWMHFM